MLYLQYIIISKGLFWLWWYLNNKQSNEDFQNKIENFQYRTCLVITVGIQGTSREQLYDELGLYSLVRRSWCNKLVFFYSNCKLFSNKLSLFLSRFLFSRKLSVNIIINLYYKTNSNKNKILKTKVFPILYKLIL